VKKYQKALAFRYESIEYQSVLTMNGPERLAGPNVVQQIKHACLDDDVHTQRNIVLWGLSRVVLIDAPIRHIDEGCKIHIKVYPTGGQGYHGSLLLDPDDFDTVYFEVKLQDNRVQVDLSRSWLQVKEHSTGYPPLPR
jgi:hypothetical protein